MSKNTRKQINGRSSFLVLAIALVVVLGVVSGVRANVGGAQDLVLRGLSSYLETNPSSDRANKVVDFLLGAVGADEASLGAALTRDQANNSGNFNGIGLLDPNNPSRKLDRQCRTEAFPKSTSTIVSMQNLSRNNLLIDHLAVYVTRPASASVVLSFGTSSVNSAPYNAGSASTSSLPWGLVDRYFIGASASNTGFMFSNATLGTSTEAAPSAIVGTGQDTTSSSVHFSAMGVGNIIAVTSLTTAKVLRVGKNNDSRLEVRPDQYFLGHLEVGEWPVASPYRYAVTTTVTSTLTESNRVAVAGDVGLQGLVEYCWTSISTSTPQ